MQNVASAGGAVSGCVDNAELNVCDLKVSDRPSFFKYCFVSVSFRPLTFLTVVLGSCMSCWLGPPDWIHWITAKMTQTKASQVQQQAEITDDSALLPDWLCGNWWLWKFMGFELMPFNVSCWNNMPIYNKFGLVFSFFQVFNYFLKPNNYNSC